MQSYDAAEFEPLVAKYEKLNWRIISKPGGATVKPDEFYTLHGCVPGTVGAGDFRPPVGAAAGVGAGV